MIESIQLENFKAFGQRATVPLAPITLIFGQNSAGKSSILQSLNLLKQTRESRDVDALLLPRTENGFADLGSYQELLFDHDLERTLSIRLDVSLGNTWREFGAPRFLRRADTLGLEIEFSRRTSEEEITLEGFKLCGADPAKSVADFKKCELPPEMRRYAGLPFRSERRRAPATLRAARCTAVHDDPTYWTHAYEWSKREKKRLVDVLRQVENSLKSGGSDPATRGLFDEDEVPADSRERMTSKVSDYIAFVSSDFSYSDYVGRMQRDQTNKVVALDGFLPTVTGRFGGDLDGLINRFSMRTGFRREWSQDVVSSAVYAGRAVEQALTSLFPLGPFRKPPSRWYIFTGTTPQDVGYEGHLLPDLLFRQPELRTNTNEWLRKLDIGYDIEIRSLGNVSSDLFELRLIDTRRKSRVDVGLTDVGFGISQLLPFLVQSLAASNQIISIEQPEVHIHPRLQADLGDLLIESIQSPRRNQFIIETHSEHLALRLQRRIREKKISPTDVSIVYVSRGPNGGTVQPLRLDETGDFIDDFPGGFFPERLQELR